MNFALKVVVFIALMAAIALVGKSLLKKDEPERVAPRHYTLRPRDIEQSVYGSGVLRCSKRAEIVARIGGKIKELLVEEGDAVEPSQVLCKMTNEKMERELSTADKGFRFEKDDYEDKKRSHEAGGPPSEAELAKLKFQLDKQEDDLEELRKKVEALTVKSPPSLSGIVLKSHLKREEINLDPDKEYPEGKVLFEVGDLTSLGVDGTILESDSHRVEENDPATVQAGRKGWLPAKVSYLSLIPVSEGGRYKIRLEFDKAPSDLNEGLTVDFRIIIEKRKNVLAVPVEYVEVEAGRHWVKQVIGEKVTRVPIEVGISSDSFYEVKSGLKEGDVIRWDAGVGE